MTPLILLLIGFFLIFLEFYLPGAVMGITGGVLVFVALILFVADNPSPIAIFLAVIGVVVSLVLLVKFAIWRIRTAKADNSIYSADNQVGFQACSYDSSMIGKSGVVVTDLKPGGHILIEGQRLQAISQNNYLVKGTEVLVIGGQEQSLIVKPKNKEHS